MEQKQIDNFHLAVEWESFEWPIEIHYPNTINKNYLLPSDSIITIFRNDGYDLKGTIQGIITSEDDLEYKINGQEPVAGQLIKGDEVIGYDSIRNRQYKIKHFILKNSTFSVSGSPRDAKHHFNSRISFDFVEESFVNDDREVDCVTEFFLTGSVNLFFPRSTDRSKEEKFSRVRRGLDPEVKVPNLISSRSHGGSNDYFIIETSEFNFIVQLVDQTFLPKWANGFQIEYRRSFKMIPDEETRKGIAEIVGFILGTQFLKIGESHFDSNSKVVKKFCNNPWGDNVVSKCQSSAMPPISFADHTDRHKIERVLNKVVPNYLSYRRAFGLENVIWKYWISNDLAIGTNLPILSSALESLIENYIEAKSLVRKYSKPEKDIYAKLIKTEIEVLARKLTPYDFSHRILDKLQYPYYLGIGEKMKIFLSNLDIQFNNESVENEALKARNKMTHSSIEASEDEILKYVKLTRAFQTLVNRIILKVVGFDGAYVDYYSIGHPQKDLSQNI